MLVQWMAYATLIAAFAYAGAIAVERVAAIWNVGQRFVWLAALVAASLTPVVLATRPADPVQATPATHGIAGSISKTVMVFAPSNGPRTRSALEKFESRSAAVLPGLDPILRVLWLAASLMWVGLLLSAAVRVRRQRGRWRALILDGAEVFVAPNLGPAVVGALKPRVIIPEWALLLDSDARALMLRHESEHIRARDPLMLFAGVLLVTLFPWNPALWMLMRRLRLAIEIDCDGRVLRSSSQQREYGILLLTVGARHTAPMPFATSLAERRPFLERRIRAMTDMRPRNPRLTSTACVVVAMIVLTAAVRAPRPQALSAQAPAVAAKAQSVTPAPAHATAVAASIASTEPAPARASSVSARSSSSSSSAMPAPARAATSSAATTVMRARAKGQSLTEEEIRALIAVHYPSVLKGDPSINLITFIIDAKGNYVASSSAYQPTAAQEERTRDDIKMTGDAAALRIRGRSGSGAFVVRSDATPADSAKRAAEEALVRNRLLDRIVGDSIVIASGFQGKISGSVIASGDTVVAIGGQRTSFLNGLNINSDDIDNVEVLKTTGKFGPLPIGVIVIQMK